MGGSSAVGDWLLRALWIVFVVLLVHSCTHRSSIADPKEGGYPPHIAAIIINKCAVAGCHNNLSYVNADGLNLATWSDLFKGGSRGAAVIPYRADFSPVCFFTNTYPDLGIALKPTMPYDRTPLSRSEYITLRDWITAGAPSAGGSVAFADDPSRKKYYVTNRLCEVVTVIDAASLLQTRYIDVGDNAQAKFPYCIKVSPDRAYWYVSFFSQAGYVEKFSAVNDKLVGRLNLGPGSWTAFEITSDSKHAFFVESGSIGKIAYVDLDIMQVKATYTFGGNFKYLTGIALNEQFRKLYVGATTGNYMYVIDIADPLSPVIKECPLDGKGLVLYQSMLDPVELLSVPQSGLCYIGCSHSGEIRVFDMQYDKLVKAIPIGTNPAFMSYSESAQKLLVSCPDDTASFPGNRGAVLVIDAVSNSFLKRINTGYQPYGIAVDDDRKVAVVVNANISSAGPESHHVSGCGKKNGNVTFIDMETLELLPRKVLEVAVFPFGVAVR